MRLFEYEGKQLFARYDVPVPKGGLWPDLPADLRYPVAVKTQLLEGGRGKRGGIRFAATPEQAKAAAEGLLAGAPTLAPAEAVLVEEKLEIAREFYLALLMDRDSGGPLLLASSEGGVEIESVPDEKILRMPINPLIGMAGFVTRQVALTLGLGREHQSALGGLLAGLWRAFNQEDCLLAEINPLVLTKDGQLVAADARIGLDGYARPLHQEWRDPKEGTAFEQRVGLLGATGAEMEGDLAVVTSGAGLGMATVDTVAALGIKPRCFVDLGGTVFMGSEVLENIVQAVRDLKPKAILFNYFFHLARCDILAAGIAAAYRRRPPECPVVVRMRGVNHEDARELLTPFNFFITDDVATACRAAVEAARGNA